MLALNTMKFEYYMFEFHGVSLSPFHAPKATRRGLDRSARFSRRSPFGFVQSVMRTDALPRRVNEASTTSPGLTSVVPVMVPVMTIMPAFRYSP